MPAPSIERKELIARLKEEFGEDEPIFTKEIISSWKEYSRPRVFQLLKDMCSDGTITRYDRGVYYFPKTSFWNTPLPLSVEKVAEKRYMKADGKVFGYYSGLTLLNYMGLSNQVPNTDEIVTMNETTRVREVVIGKFYFRLRRSKMQITKENAPLLQVLEIFNKIDAPLERYQKENIFALLGNKPVDKALLLECAKCFPKRALKNLMNSEIGALLVA
ncbi:MAG: hypothetical protein FWF40_03560 [Methanomassiliicoccaceae archaeon]|nr:hypothetical protein [Methanomassiliicoccaceae archaeon]